MTSIAEFNQIVKFSSVFTQLFHVEQFISLTIFFIIYIVFYSTFQCKGGRHELHLVCECVRGPFCHGCFYLYVEEKVFGLVLYGTNSNSTGVESGLATDVRRVARGLRICRICKPAFVDAFIKSRALFIIRTYSSDLSLHTTGKKTIA